jgi:cellulose synthase/poly-beta-1,6-N-acetylglucosamine synthase-like glycosyltransferase
VDRLLVVVDNHGATISHVIFNCKQDSLYYVINIHKVRYLRAQSYDVSWLHRDNRAGFKGGALDNGLRTAKGELIAIFDADFIPKPDILKNALVPLVNDSRVGWVQTRWNHINRRYSWLTDTLAFGIDGHFYVEQTCRSAENLASNFCGTCGFTFPPLSGI